MGAVRVDMGSTCPFFKGEKQVRGVDENYDDEANHEHREHNPDGLRQTKPTEEQKAKDVCPHISPLIPPSWR
jgi:hypothetical protein